MTENIGNEIKNEEKEKLLLMLLPFWTPLIPPLGISCLKSYLVRHGYDVVTVDGNTEMEMIDLLQNYTMLLKKIIKEDRQGNFYNMAYEVLRNHSMAYQSYIESEQITKSEYEELIKIIVRKNYFCEIEKENIDKLDKILDKFYKALHNYIIGLIEKHQPTIVGFSTYSGSLPATLFSMKLIKKNYPHIKTIMGGGIFSDQLAINSINFNHFIENTPYIDKLIVGEGERIFLSYLQGNLPEDQKVYTLQDVAGELVDFNEVDIPDFSDFDILNYPQIASYASRSCPFQCSFCSETVLWGKYRHKDVKQIIEELKLLYDKYKYQLFLLSDSLLNPIISKLSEALINNNYSFYFDGYLRAGVDVTIENAMKWRKAGYYRARLGVESGSPHVLELMDKRITPELIKSSVRSLANAGIKTTTYWVIGHPGETEEDFKQTLDLIEELKDDIYEAECNVFQYSVGAQVESDKWYKEYGISTIYPEKYSEILMSQMWQVNTEPTRDVVFDRVCRFVAHCRKLGLQNPYSFRDIYLADKRWEKLHKYAVPIITEFREKGKVLTENTNIEIS